MVATWVMPLGGGVRHPVSDMARRIRLKNIDLKVVI
jgi:hypothetical protein